VPAPWGLALVSVAAVVEVAETFFWIRISRRWRVRAGAEGTRVELRIQFGVAGAGFWGWLSERFAAPIVRGNVKRTLAQLKRAVEHEQVRADRRAAATSR
jgi:hypothetical protein